MLRLPFDFKQDRRDPFGPTIAPSRSRIETMLWTIFVILLVLWLLGVVTSYTMGGFIHILLVVAIAVVLINVITGRRAV
jgi:predicted ferric reductase